MTRSAINQFGDALDVFRLQSDQGQRLAVPATGSVSTAPLPAGVYMLSTSVNVYVRTGTSTAVGDQAGSFLMPAGSAAYFRLIAGERISVAAVEEAGALFILPTEE